MGIVRNFSGDHRSGFLAHPLTLFVSAWLLCFLLYAMHLSGLLIVDTSDVRRIVEWIIVPFVVTIGTFNLLYFLAPKARIASQRMDIEDESYVRRVDASLNRWFWIWIALTAIEVIGSGGVPIAWLLLGSDKNYTDFGLPVVHVFIMSMLSVISLGKIGLYIVRGNRHRLIIPVIQLVWAVVIISRGALIGALIQWAILWLCLRGASLKAVFRAAIISTLVILLFGYIGDFRSSGGGVSSFRDLARPTSNYPDWLPSGVLWIYVYITSPLDNLAYTSLSTSPSYNPLFPRTTYYAFPTVIRDALYGKTSNLGQGGDLVASSLNVSSAYIGPLMDDGFFGIACFSMLLGLISGYLWKRRSTLQSQILYSIMAQCLVLSIFWNFLFYNPFLGQVFWIYLIFNRKQFRLFPRRKPIVSSILEAGS